MTSLVARCSALSTGLLLTGMLLVANATAQTSVPETPRIQPSSQTRNPIGASLGSNTTTPPGAPEDAVSLGTLLTYADNHSPLLVAARSTRARAGAAEVAASVLLPANPTVSVAAGPRLGDLGTGLDIEVSLTQQVQIAGERGLRLDAAKRLRELTEAEIDYLRWTVHCDVHAGFHRALVEQERARLALRVVKFQQEVLRTVERQIAAGDAAPLTLRLAQAEVAQAQQVLIAAEQSYFASRLRLAQLSGWSVDAAPNPGGTVDTPREPPSLERLKALALERLPNLKAQASRIREAEARVVVADREAWPKPSVGVQYRREGNPTTEGAYDIFMGVISIPLPSFQTNQGERAQSRADVAVARANLNATQSLLQGQIAEAYSEVMATALRTQAYGAEILPRFEENLVLLGRSFELGEIDILALSAGRERFLRIQNDALGAQLDYFVALAGLERVIGVDLWHDDFHDAQPNASGS